MLLALNAFPPAAVALLVLGLILIVAECFIPGFGVFGILGIVSLIVSIILFSSTWWQATILIVILLAILVAAFAVLSRLASQGKLSPKLFLRTATSSSLGFDSARDYSGLIACEGVAQTVLRPAGVALIRGGRYDVVTQGEYIEKGSRITVTAAEGNRIVVEKRV